MTDKVLFFKSNKIEVCVLAFLSSKPFNFAQQPNTRAIKTKKRCGENVFLQFGVVLCSSIKV